MFASDKPVETSCDDLLGRSSFAEQLANAIASYSNADSCTIGLYGKWGAGKTSVINMITETLEERNKRGDKGNQIIIVHFNPWNYSDRAQIIDQFFKTISTELKITNAPKALKTVGDALEKYSGALENVTAYPICLKLLKQLGPESAYEKLKAGAMGDNLSITATCIKAFWNIKRAYGQVGSHPNYEHRLIEEDKITDLESTVRAAFKELYKTDDLFRSGYFGELSRIWRQLDEAECKEYELNCISKLENIPYFLEDCKGSWTSGGAHGPIFFNENFEGYISTESLYEKVCLLKGSDIYNQLTDTLKNTVVAFYLWYASVGQGGDGKITEEKISEERKSWDA